MNMWMIEAPVTPHLQLVARCLAGCGATEPFDLNRLAFCQRDLPLDAVAVKLRCRCGSRQVAVEVVAQQPLGSGESFIVWYA